MNRAERRRQARANKSNRIPGRQAVRHKENQAQHVNTNNPEAANVNANEAPVAIKTNLMLMIEGAKNRTKLIVTDVRVVWALWLLTVIGFLSHDYMRTRETEMSNSQYSIVYRKWVGDSNHAELYVIPTSNTLDTN